MRGRRVAVTGVGLVSPLGSEVAKAWQKLRSGKSGVVPITSFDAVDYPVRIGAELQDFDPDDWVNSKFQRQNGKMIWYGMAAGMQAMEDCALKSDSRNSSKYGVFVGSGIGGLDSIIKNHKILLEKGPTRVSPFLVPGGIINMISGNLANHFKLRGPNLATATACATASHAIGLAARLIAAGECDAMLAGGSEHTLNSLSVAAFAAMRALSRRNDAPQLASRPWDRDRDGFVLADGSGILMLEEYNHALKRGARIYCELSGVGFSSDAYHITAPPKDGAGAAQAIKRALGDAGRDIAEQIGYINAHSTGTQLGDISETNAIKTVFGDRAKRIPISSNKSMIGHSLGASGGIEAVFTVMSLQHQCMPATINLECPDEDCDLDYIPAVARKSAFQAAISNSLGFGGTNCCLVFYKSS